MTTPCSRRDFLQRSALAGAFVALAPGANSASARRQMKLCLVPGSIGVQAGPRQVVALAKQHGFEAVEANTGFLAGLTEADLAAYLGTLKDAGLGLGQAGLTVDFRGDEDRFRASLEGFPKVAAALQRAGVDRVGTWLSPSHGTLAYAENFKQHARRLREVAKVLRDHGQRLGLEYVGTPTLHVGKPNPFIFSLKQMRELMAEIGTGNVGVVLDCWHWWTAGETAADLLQLKPADVISVDLNDAPVGIPVERQQDGKRELPCATGVIPLKVFLGALQQIGFDGPVRAEPFNKPLNDLDDQAACAAVGAALKKAMALIEG